MYLRKKLVIDFLKETTYREVEEQDLFVGLYSGEESIAVRIGQEPPFPINILDLIAFTYSRIK